MLSRLPNLDEILVTLRHDDKVVDDCHCIRRGVFSNGDLRESLEEMSQSKTQLRSSKVLTQAC